ncbi:uncharacterized protein LOC119836196 [Zerene cesonia]|uniref:uncharacterized protein LOC119836196 n=1 Tax=Zerene cesonia TaxID=33412 RepID=UPI0018E55EF9|nr:uncharacterized protein LOC119836196 [Zerene cesonia]XP_038217397.1 uncharacterized protein LOC119836196 [Zerene cesonia]
MNNFSSKTQNIISNDSNFVATVGSSWIVCRSKSQPGRIYYFNTVTGEAAWNLSDAEAERAKKTTLETSHKLKLTEFPEPEESPQDYLCNNNQSAKQALLQNIAPAKIYNKQIINNKFTRQPHPSTSYNHFAPFNTLNPVGYAYTPVVNVPANSIILAPPINTIQTSIETNFTPMQKKQTFDTPVPLSKCFTNFQNKNFSRPSFNPRIFNKRNIFQNKNAPSAINSSVDLRQKLMTMRKRNQSFNNTISKAPNYPLFCNKEVIEDNEVGSVNSDAFTEELINEIDVQALKSYFGVSSEAEYWFVVADEDVLLNHTNFLIKIIQLDEKFRLVIPQVVIIKIQGLTTSVHNKASLEAASFISEALESNFAIVDEENYDTEDYYESIFSCCLKLINQNCEVVLISEKEISPNDYGFSMHTLKDIKAFLVDRKVNEDPKITITIPNDSRDEVFLNSTERNKSTAVITEEINFADAKTNKYTVDKGVQTDNKSHIADIAIQTDFDIPKIIPNLYNDEKNAKGLSNKSEKKPRFIRRNIGFNVTNNLSNKHTDTEDKKVFIEKGTSTKEHDNIDIFKISSKAMEDYLKVKSDEWVSRFVQIMEEALTQVLQQDPSFVLDMPPPWTIYEASECIKRKFSNDCDVFDASSKLSNILFEMGGLRGKINNNIAPEMYMKMYSYGYYLIDALQSFIRNNEDLQIAGTSLIKLLSDIQNPHLDPSNSDSFTDLESSRNNDSIIYSNQAVRNEQARANPPKTALVSNYDVPSKSPVLKVIDTKILRKESSLTNLLAHQITKNVSPEKQRIVQKSPKTNKEDKQSPTEALQKVKYNLRNKKSKAETNDVATDQLNANPKDSFMTKLSLANSNQVNNDTIDPIDAITPINGHSFDDNQIEGPKIMRNFTVCPEFEKRLQSNSNAFSEEMSDDQKLDYEQYEESVISEPDDANEYDKNDSQSFCRDEECRYKLSESFRNFLDEVGTKVKESFLKVYSFCENSKNKLVSSVESYQKVEIRAKAEKMFSFVENMCSSLKRILDRETNDTEGGNREILIKLGFESKDIDDKELEYYRSFIEKCVIQGSILQQSLKLLIEATQENV